MVSRLQLINLLDRKETGVLWLLTRKDHDAAATLPGLPDGRGQPAPGPVITP
jgi:hypothetical protein